MSQISEKDNLCRYLVEHSYLVGIADGGKAVRDDKRCSMLDEGVQVNLLVT